MNLKPFAHSNAAAINNEIPISTACTKYNTGTKNIKEDSSGSVTQVKNAAIPSAKIKKAVFFFYLIFVV